MPDKVGDTNPNADAFSQLSIFGKFQYLQYFLICLPLIVVSMMNVNYIFVAENVNFRCRVPECDGLDGSASVSTPSWWPEALDTKCFRPVYNLSKANATCSYQKVVAFEECDDWIYEHTNSVIPALDIGCQSWKASFVGTVHNMGMMFSMILMGWIADKFGRKFTVVICAVGGSIGMIKIFLNNFYAYIGVEFLESFIASGLYTVATVWMIEVGGETKRVAAGVIFSYAIYMGEVIFAFVAMGFKHWKILILAAYTPGILFITYIVLLRESTRWQMLRGKTAESKSTFKIIAKLNKLNITNDEIDNISECDLKSRFDVASQKQKETIKEIIKSKEIMKRLAVSSFSFFTACFVYYGLAVQAVSLPGNKYLNFVLTSLTSFPGDLLAFYTFPRYGRKLSLQGGFIACGLFIIAQAFTPDSFSWLKIILFLVGKLGTAMCFTGIYTYSLELFPTSVRGTLFGFCNMCARVGSMLSPLTPLLVTQLTILPSLLFATTALTAAVLLYYTPETKSLPLFDTIEQIETYNEKITTRL